MVSKRGKLEITKDESINRSYQKYQSLKQEVNNWHQERSSYWLAALDLAQKPPYLPIMDLPDDAIIELWQRLNIVAEAQIPDAELKELWKQIKDGQSIINQEMISRLQIAISGVAGLAGEKAQAKGVPAVGLGYVASNDPSACIICPVCGETATMAVLTESNGQRIMHCTACGFEWSVKRTGCLHCGCEDAKQQMYLKNEEFPGIEMVVCQVCGQYFKEIDGRKLLVKDYVWEDLRTLPLNYATELWLEEQIKKNNQIN